LLPLLLLSLSSCVCFRYRGRCKVCPNTAWLIFLAFFIALASLVAASVYMSKRRINLAALGIGVVRHCVFAIVVGVVCDD
jgi:hypothetical protein